MSLKSGFWRKCRFAFRCVRFAVWALVLIILGALIWLDRVGVPDFVKTRIVAALQERNVQLEFTRMRFNLIHGLLCDKVSIGAIQETNNPVLTAREVQLRLDLPALLHRKLEVKSIVLHQGDFSYPLAANDSLNLTNLESALRFESDDTWALDQFHADFAGVTFMLGGEIAHAPEFQHWKMFSSAKSADRGDVQASLRNLSDALKKIHFEGRPQITARLNGDAEDVNSFEFTITTHAPGIKTPWFSAHDLQFAARVQVSTNAPPSAGPDWGFWTNVQPFRINWTAHGKDLQIGEFKADAADCGGNWLAPQLTITNLSAQLGGGSLEVTSRLDVVTRVMEFNGRSDFDLHAAALLPEIARDRLSQITWTEPPQIHAGGSLALPAWTNNAAAWRDGLEPGLNLHGDLALTNAIIASRAKVNSVYTHFTCTEMNWTLPDLHVSQGRTSLDLSGEEDENTKNFRCVLGGALDSDSITPFLTNSNAVRGFKHLYFRDPVALMLDLTGNLRNFDSLSVTGRVVATHFAIRGQFVDSLKMAVTYTNLTVEFLQPQLSRENGAEAFTAQKITLDIPGQKIFIRAGAGNISSMAIASAIGPKTAKNFEPYQFLKVPHGTVEGCIPLKQKSDAEEDLDPSDADLWVHMTGTTPFQWMRFRTPQITGDIHWFGHYLILTNVVSECYGGSARAWGRFDVQTPGDGTDFSFFVDGTNVDFNAMGRALWSPTNQLRGSLAGNVNITSANSSDWRTWDGYGQMQLRNGLIWNAPIFGLMSPLLNSITPGLDVGNSRATDGAGRFTMTNGVIYTDSLEIRSLTMRLQYIGTVDLRENVSARARAQLLRNTPVVGQLLSAVLWPVGKVSECGVTGTLEKPKVTPIYIPFANVITAPLHPWRTMEGIFALPQTNSVWKQ